MQQNCTLCSWGNKIAFCAVYVDLNIVLGLAIPTPKSDADIVLDIGAAVVNNVRKDLSRSS